jgi:hypothetical protein
MLWIPNMLRITEYTILWCYKKNWRTHHFRNWNCFPSQVRGWGDTYSVEALGKN